MSTDVIRKEILLRAPAERLGAGVDRLVRLGRRPAAVGRTVATVVRWPAARLYALEFARPEYAERHARETPFRIALARVKPKDKDSGDVERFRLRQVTNRDGRAVALDRLTLRLQTLPRREGYWLDTGMLKTG